MGEEGFVGGQNVQHIDEMLADETPQNKKMRV